MRTILKQDEYFILYEHEGISTFKGCQCIKDCDCFEQFKPTPYHYFSVFKNFSKKKITTHHKTLEEAHEKVEYLKELYKIYKNPNQ